MRNSPGILSRKYGQLLLSLDLIDQEQMNRALAEQEKTGENLDTILIRNEVVNTRDVFDNLGRYLGVDSVNLKGSKIPSEVLDLVPVRFVHRYNILPIEKNNGTLKIATADPLNFSAIDDLRLLLKCEVEPVLATSEDIADAIKNYYGIGSDTLDSIMAEEGLSREHDMDTEVEELTEDASIIKFVNQIISEAVDDRATDIHIEPFENDLRIRYRIDGLLYEASVPPSIRHYQSAVISRIKIMADMNIAEKRLPQDGRIPIRLAGKEYDLRVSTVPTPWGESIVIRILHRSSTLLQLEDLGFDGEALAKFNSLILKPNGIIFVTGPTGSGKTTTLYAALAKLNSIDRKIITIEDPIEYHMNGIIQIQIQTKIELTFARVLRSLLRQDPDVLLVGETRDYDTAETAIQSSLTGHLVLSTLHTNDAPGAVSRLLDMGVEPFLVSSSVIGIMAQRLVRVICKNCKEQYEPARDILKGLNVPEEKWNHPYFRGRGCDNCKFLGYRGRLGIFEIALMTEEIRELTVNRVPASRIKRVAMEQGMRTLRQDGLEKVYRGLTTLDEIVRVTQEDLVSN